MSKKGRRRQPQNPGISRPEASPSSISPSILSPSAGRWSTLLLACLLLVFPALQVGRFAHFAATESGMEHDSGWYFGVARNLAERGIYAASTNMATTPDAVSPGIHSRPSVQDAEGYSYFCSGVTVGPGFIVPEALVLKIFGIGWWQYRLLPLAGMFALLVLLSALAYRGGGPLATLLLQVWLWVLPTVTFKFAFEAYAEHLALLYSLLAIAVYAYGGQLAQPKRWPWFTCGLLLALAFLTKSVYLLTAFAVGLHWLGTLFQRRPETRAIRTVVLFVALGFLLPVAVFEGYRFVSLVQQFGLEGYRANSVASALVFRSAGSGLASTSGNRLALMATKVTMLENLGFRMAVFAWPLVLLGFVLALQPTGERVREPQGRWIQTVLEVAGLKVLLVLAWFVLLSSSTFTRHAWDGLVLLLLLTSIGVARAWHLLLQRRLATSPLVLMTLLLVAVNLACFDYALADASPRITFERAMQWLTPYNRPLQPLMFAPVFRRDLQEEAVAFLDRTVGPEDRLYYIQHHKLAELPPLLGRVFFSIDRYEADQPSRRGRSFIILGPFQVGDWPWRIEKADRMGPILAANRQQIVFQNDLYVVLQEPFQDLEKLLAP